MGHKFAVVTSDSRTFDDQDAAEPGVGHLAGEIRNGGSESYPNLIEHYGDEAFIETLEKPTASGRFKLHRLPKPIKGNGEFKAKRALA